MQRCAPLTEHRTQANFCWNGSIHAHVAQLQILWNMEIIKSVLIFLVASDSSHPHDSRKENLPRNLNCPISLGSLPCSDVALPVRIDKLVSSPISDGIVPITDVISKCNPVKWVRSPISVGIVPPFLLPESARRTASLKQKGSKPCVRSTVSYPSGQNPAMSSSPIFGNLQAILIMFPSRKV